MNISQSFRLAIKSLMMSKMRALLTMLGIIIGVAAVIVIISLGNGMQNMMNDEFDKLGANMIQVQMWGVGSSRQIEPENMYALVEKYPQYLSDVTPYVATTALVSHNTTEYTRTKIYGVGESFITQSGSTMQGETLADGRFLQYIDVDRHQNVCVVGSYLAQDAFYGDPLGQTLSIGGAPYTIIGVLDEKSDSTESSGDDMVYIPYTKALQLSNSANANVYLFNSTSKDTAPMAKGIIENRLYQTFQDDDNYIVVTSAEMMDVMNSLLNTLMIVLVAIAAISLLVGGIGIMNIMLVSVTERTREIGIRKSLGAKRRDIRSQFIIEAGTTSAIGGVLGIFLGVLMANAATAIVGAFMSAGSGNFSATPTLFSVLISFGVSVFIGILFGYLPANKAAKLNPIDALRYD